MTHDKKLKTEINKALERLKNLLNGTQWAAHKQGAYGIVAYNTVTKQKTNTVYALYSEDFVDYVLAEIRFIEASNH